MTGDEFGASDLFDAPLAGAGEPWLYNSTATSDSPALDTATVMAHVALELETLWHDAIKGDKAALSERLVDASHALQRAARLLDQDRAIG